MSHIQTKILAADDAGIAQAVAIWRSGGLVSFATETVYGLGADATNDTAVAGIFAAKGRPQFNPLIAHVADIEMAKRFVEWPEDADKLAEAFWPGPLSLVLPLKTGSGISPLVTAGLSSLAIRLPAHPMARQLLGAFGKPVAAPSANPSGKISPTTAAHVMAGLGGKIDAVLDGGSCDVGLESTIVGLLGAPALFRPGGVPLEAIEDVLDCPLAVETSPETLQAPGQMSSHYAPGASVRLNARHWNDGELRLGFGGVDCDLNLSAAGDLIEAAANLFHHLHALDARGAANIAVSPIPRTGLGAAINDRLERAAAPRG